MRFIYLCHEFIYLTFVRNNYKYISHTDTAIKESILFSKITYVNKENA